MKTIEGDLIQLALEGHFDVIEDRRRYTIKEQSVISSKMDYVSSESDPLMMVT